MRQAYDDEDNMPMFGDLPLPYPVRTWDEMIKGWEGKHNADGQGAISGRSRAVCEERTAVTPAGHIEGDKEDSG